MVLLKFTNLKVFKVVVPRNAFLFEILTYYYLKKSESNSAKWNMYMNNTDSEIFDFKDCVFDTDTLQYTGHHKVDLHS